MNTMTWAGIILLLIALLSATGTTFGIIPSFGTLIDVVLAAAGAYLFAKHGRR